jgi:hypothetical protein
MSDEQTLKQMQVRIACIKEELQAIGDMRPGTLSQQYRDGKNKLGAYHQLSYTYKMKSRTDYIRQNYVEVVRSEVEQYKRFKELTEEWLELAMQVSKEKMKFMRETTPKKPTRIKEKK